MGCSVWPMRCAAPFSPLDGHPHPPIRPALPDCAPLAQVHHAAFGNFSSPSSSIPTARSNFRCTARAGIGKSFENVKPGAPESVGLKNEEIGFPWRCAWMYN